QVKDNVCIRNLRSDLGGAAQRWIAVALELDIALLFDGDHFPDFQLAVEAGSADLTGGRLVVAARGLTSGACAAYVHRPVDLDPGSACAAIGVGRGDQSFSAVGDGGENE